MSLVTFIPMALAVLLVAPIAAAPVSRRVDRVVSRIALAVFGTFVSDVGYRRQRRRSRLRAAHVPSTFREYAAKTILYAMVMALVAGILGMYVIWGILAVLAIDAATVREVMPSRLAFLSQFVGVPQLGVWELFGLVTVTSLTLGGVAGLGTYWFRWWYPETVADDRERRIEATLPNAVAFIYALSRSGMAFPEVMRTLANNREIYGETAAEVDVAVRNMDLFGMDVITAIQTMARNSPSDQFKEFSENLASVLQSGRSLSEFLRRQYDDFQEEAEANQEQFLDTLETLAEAYVTGFVAGPLFLITILVVMGISLGNTLRPLRVLVYVVLPLGNVAFMLYLASATDALSPASRIREFAGDDLEIANLENLRIEGDERWADGGTDEPSPTRERLAAYRRFRWFQRKLGDPVRTIVDRPLTLLWVTAPLGGIMLFYRLTLLAGAGNLTVGAVDDVLVQTGLFLLGTFAITYEVHRRRIEAIESWIPDFLDRFAGINEAGMTVVEAIEQVRSSELGALDQELDRVWADIRWGADVESALRRFERRVRTRTVSRVVTLINNAMNASGDLATVLRIAADQAKSDRRLKRDRRQNMLTYMVVVYISFFVFLFIIVVLDVVLMPNLPEQSIVNATGGQGARGIPAVGGVGNMGGVNKDAYRLLFFHTTVIQGLLSGFVAGQLSTGDVRAGTKHAAVLVAIAYAVFIVLLG